MSHAVNFNMLCCPYIKLIDAVGMVRELEQSEYCIKNLKYQGKSGNINFEYKFITTLVRLLHLPCCDYPGI